MTLPIRFPYTQRSITGEETGYVPLLPLVLEKDGRAQSVAAMLDTGAAVNVMPYSVGAALGFVFENETVSVSLSGNLNAVPTRIILVTATVASFVPVRLAFAWAKTDSVPLLLGQVNFFAAFDVCFYRSQLAFEVAPKSSVP
jgi:pseudouridine-5'-phosphate glycosidase